VVARYVLARMLHSVAMLVLATLVVFSLLRAIPGDPAEVMLGEMATPDTVAALRKALSLDRPILVQYASYMARLARGDFGVSLRARRPVDDVIVERAPATILLACAAMLIAAGMGIPLGVLAALHRHSLLQMAASGLSLLGQAMPAYWLGLLLMNLFAVRLGWLPVSGSDSWFHLILPAATLAAFVLGLLLRLTRSAMLEVMGEDYIRSARAKGLSPGQTVRRHALKLALIPVLTVAGLQMGNLMSGAVITEAIFGWPGLGSLAVLAVHQRDYPLMQALVLLSALTFVFINFVVDMLYVRMDPRIAYH
jgi:peptide/nickel transport system permease protein